mgnify:CR=1 FL=1
MYFKQIELHGFKSFADRTSINLEPGITAIVGPNGCGKSNILDALRWALGEQSAKALRGDHMQDIIFNGSGGRPATGMAEVSLTFDNADSQLPIDYSEVQVTRRLYRSGESEYMINKAPCRLRDVLELFMDTGIGTNAYSLIGQGKIDMVISSRPEDRRFLFEEAAGIIKYKKRKTMAMRKLESAEQNMLRLGDIIAEVERQRRSLKRQVNAAIRHRELTQALRELEIRNAWLQYNELTGQVADLRDRLAAAVDHYEKLSADTSTREAELEELSVQRIEMDRDLMARREREHEIDTEMERIENQISLLRKEIEFCRERAAAAIAEQENLLSRAESLSQDGGAVSERALALEEEAARVRDELAACQTAHGEASLAAAAADRRLEELRAQAIDAVNQRGRAQAEIEALTANIAEADAQMAAIEDRRGSQESRIAEVGAIVASLRAGHAAKEKELSALAEGRAKSQAERQKLSERAAALNTEWQDLRERKSSTESRLTSLKELRDSYEGFATGVRAVMMARQRGMQGMDGIIGPIGDLLSTEKEFEAAVEAALGGNVNNVVVEKADAAKAAIAFLKEHRAGRVTFLPLDTIRSSQGGDEDVLRNKPGVIGRAIDRVQCDRKIMPAVEYLLYNTVIVETIDDAIRIARTEQRYPRLVTLDGEVVSPAGSVTGGRTQREVHGLLGRSAEIEDLEKQFGETTGKIGKVTAEAARIGETIQQLAASIRAMEEQEGGLRRTVNELGLSLARQSAELEALGHTGEQIGRQRDELAARRAEFETRRADAEARFGAASVDDATLQRMTTEAQEVVASARGALESRARGLADLRVRLAELAQNLEEAERNRIREQREREQALEEATRRVGLAQQMKVRETELEQQIAALLAGAKDLSVSREEAHECVLEFQRTHKSLVDRVDALTKSLRDLREKGNSAQKEVHRLELDCSQKEDRIGFFQERIATEYGLGLASLSEEQVGSDEYDEKEREGVIQEHRKSIERLGNVNLAAIEEYDTLEKREEFLKTQAEDLNRARATLLDVVKRIDATITQMFLDTFQEISENFKNYFRRLFTGGQARIYLLDENDPLESGIEIEARPPGKKPQSISLLSGGEQAMTAIAMLVSIFAAKPSPFCVLDEVDAPLDDANVDRFLELIEEFTAQSQFIMITHNKTTMAKAGALFGVTQQELGVSQIVSVRVEDAPVN